LDAKTHVPLTQERSVKWKDTVDLQSSQTEKKVHLFVPSAAQADHEVSEILEANALEDTQSEEGMENSQTLSPNTQTSEEGMENSQTLSPKSEKGYFLIFCDL
jgi:hypothetical protein